MRTKRIDNGTEPEVATFLSLNQFQLSNSNSTGLQFKLAVMYNLPDCLFLQVIMWQPLFTKFFGPTDTHYLQYLQWYKYKQKVLWGKKRCIDNNIMAYKSLMTYYKSVI